jgi:hypothetical protein
MLADRYLLCRPRGGLNDNLCQIQLCWEYAEAHGRALIVDGKKSSMFSEFSDFFEPIDSSARVSLNSSSFDFLNGPAECFPAEVTGLINTYRATYSDDCRNMIEVTTGVQLSFDFAKRYEVPILLHDQCGGGTKSFECLNRVVLSKEMRTVVSDAFRRAGSGYIGVHVRNTDYQTDYKPFLESISSEVAGKRLLMCSDDVDAIRYAKNFFSSSDVFAVSDIPDTHQSPIHEERTKLSDEQREKNAINSIVDLLLLGMSEKLFFTNVTQGFPSGYSRLAGYLNENKDVIRGLVYGK